MEKITAKHKSFWSNWYRYGSSFLVWLVSRKWFSLIKKLKLLGAISYCLLFYFLKHIWHLTNAESNRLLINLSFDSKCTLSTLYISNQQVRVSFLCTNSSYFSFLSSNWFMITFLISFEVFLLVNPFLIIEKKMLSLV